MTSYLAADAALIRAELPPRLWPAADCDALFLVYAVLMRAKGEAVTAADVHDAWAAWTVSTRGEHRCLVPFESLDPDVQDRDTPYVEAIHRAARRRAGRTAWGDGYDRSVSSTGFDSGTDRDTSVANVARVYDYLLGGKDNFAADRQLGEQLVVAFPESGWIARENRAFIGRAVGYCAEQGLTQFLDVGSGLPTMDNVHDVARRVNPEATVVYVDNDPIALAHANALLATSEGVTAIAGDVREPAKILADVRQQGLLDLSKPFVVLLAAIFHFITDEDDPAGIIRVFKDAMPPGSYLILSTAHHDANSEKAARVTALYRNASASMVTRSKQDIAAFFDGFELVEPGMACTCQWRAPEPPGVDDPNDLYAGVGRKI
ncbi:MAG TPA: SAM-dependent methyltransferase [Streptosporangiaceae bacterium]|nr:SAM-dependent methyltransferase [Streptosporangiaceae bacterium]